MGPGPNYGGYGPPPQKSNGGNILAGVLIGCGVIGLLVVAFCGFGIYHAMQGLRDFGIEIASMGISSAIESAEGLTFDEKTRMSAQVDRVKAGFKARKITIEEAGNAMKTMMTSPAMRAISASGMLFPLTNHSQLTPEEKARVELVRKRIARGIIDGKVNIDQVNQAVGDLGLDFVRMHEEMEEEDMDDLEDDLVDEPGEGDPAGGAPVDSPAMNSAKGVEGIAVEKIRAAIGKLEALADEAGVSKDETQLKIDYADELKKLIDQTLGPKGI